jgi:hypothetical protein
MSQTARVARDLVEGDRIVFRGLSTGRVLSIAESEQIVRKPLLIVTVEMANGDLTKRTYYPSTPVVIERDP